MLAPILYHYIPKPISYLQGLALQQKIHELQLATRRSNPGKHRDVLLMLQHTPVYTTGRRLIAESDEMMKEKARLESLGADFVSTKRGGEMTYHGPGQLVIYPLLDLGRMQMGIRDYICSLEKVVKRRLREGYNLDYWRGRGTGDVPTGVFLEETKKIASIGVQVRHRLTSHGMAFNVTTEVHDWFGQIIACGLVDVKSVSLEDVVGSGVSLSNEAEMIKRLLSEEYGREIASVSSISELENGLDIR
ncbi:lipoyltransferase [Sistotremastrum suecicum HHB10207 ss-3]|uniref:Octanoyltransferase n=1 Tax=Sistotremastrum suecicum HHB10207 ss-3 TaxID=1314776 RepID=A0A166C996_9AGAM|nr:lipoyltransferase [Sistotremastrum suecicum HHB10207 ss-3]